MGFRLLHPQLCDMCAAVVWSDGHELPDGRVVCDNCHKTGVTTTAGVEGVRRRVLDVFGQFGMVLKRPAPLKVVDAKEMAKHSGLPWMPTVHHDARPMGAYGMIRNGEMLLVESGQPPALLTWTLAHESAHDWHAEHNPAFPVLEQELQEGFAQWAADEVAGRLGHRETARRQLKRPDVYGLAPRRFFRLEFMAGTDEVLAFARSIGAGRVLRLGHAVALGEQQAVQEELGRPYGGWRKAVDLSLDAELLARQGYVFASAVCCGMALRAFPVHPKLWWRWLRRHVQNVIRLLTFSAGRAVPMAVAWLAVLLIVGLVTYWLAS